MMTLSFQGETYEPIHDRKRLNRQAKRIWDLMVDGQWRTLAQISATTGDPESSVSARLRAFRKSRWGGNQVNRKRVSGGLFAYQLIAN